MIGAMARDYRIPGHRGLCGLCRSSAQRSNQRLTTREVRDILQLGKPSAVPDVPTSARVMHWAFCVGHGLCKNVYSRGL